MDVIPVVKERDVVDYDFMFVNGNKLSVVVDESAGDVAKEESDRYLITITAKPSYSNPLEMLNPEELAVFKGHLAVFSKVSRKQRLPTEEELFDMRKTTHGLPKLVQ